MVRHTFTAALAAVAFVGSAFAQKGSREAKCPADAPCGGCTYTTMSHLAALD